MILQEVEQLHIPVVQAIPLADLVTRWEDYYHDRVEIALEKSFRAEDTPEAVMDNLLNGTAAAIAVRLGAVDVGIAIVDTVAGKDGNWLNVWTISGKHIDLWLDDFIDFIENWAGLLGYQGIMCGGRLGWERVLGKREWRKTAVIMQKRVSV